MSTYTTTETKKILHENGEYWVSNEGTSLKPKYHVWRTGLTHSVADSAYGDLSLAIARADYLAKREPEYTFKEHLRVFHPDEYKRRFG